ncbi:MAG: 3'-5' exonuclease [Bacteroidetes bacterium]|nr:MAG: 3'-5' exonuclease [Bacteroidota bacterium]
MQLNLKRPITFFDIESTGTNVVQDRIVEICFLKLMPDGTTETKIRRINPTIPIPPEVTAIHGISNEDVANEPTFKQISKSLYDWLKDCDLAGYNSNKFDVPMLIEEFLRCDIDFNLKNRSLVDVQNIFHKMEPRTLKAAYKFYCDKELVDAHSAEADTIATYEILLSQIERYKNTEFTDNEGNTSVPVKNDIQALYQFSYNHRNADLVGHIVFNAKGKESFNFGKHKGKAVEDVFSKEPQYYDWMMNADFPLSTKNIIKEIRFRALENNNMIIKKQ